jgi:hypothetical protein
MPKDAANTGTDQRSKIGFRPAHLHTNRRLADLEHNLRTEFRTSTSHNTIVNHQHHRRSLSVAPQATDRLEPLLPTTTLDIVIAILHHLKPLMCSTIHYLVYGKIKFGVLKVKNQYPIIFLATYLASSTTFN